MTLKLFNSKSKGRWNMPRGVWDRNKTKEQRDLEKSRKTKVPKKAKVKKAGRRKVQRLPRAEEFVGLGFLHDPKHAARMEAGGKVHGLQNYLLNISQVALTLKGTHASAELEAEILGVIKELREARKLAFVSNEEIKAQLEEAKIEVKEEIKESMRERLSEIVPLTPKSADELAA